MTFPFHLVAIPASHLDRVWRLPVGRVEIHAKEPHTLAIHRMCGFAEQQAFREACVSRATGGYHVCVDQTEYVLTGSKTHSKDITGPASRVIAIASFLYGYDLAERVMYDHGRGLNERVRKEVFARTGGARYGVSIVPCAPDLSEFLFVRKDHLHPVPYYVMRLSMLGGGVDAHEILEWGDEFPLIAALRELYEEVRDVHIADEIAEAFRYAGPCPVVCYLYEPDGSVTRGVNHLFLAVADNREQYARWRKLFEAGSNGISEANPVILSRKELLDAIEHDERESRERQKVLDFGVVPTEHLNNSYFTMHLHDNPAEWCRRRELALKEGRFPSNERGDFYFVAGLHASLKCALAANQIV